MSVAYAINDSGQIAGSTTAGTSDNLGTHAFLYSHGAMSDLGALFHNADNPGYSVACALNDVGQVVGMSHVYARRFDTDAFNIHAFLYSDEAMIDLDPFGTDSWAFGINNAGQVVGHYQALNAGRQPFLWSDANHNGRSDLCELVNLNTLIPADAGWVLREAYAITDNGYILAEGIHNGWGGVALLRAVNGSAPIATFTNAGPVEEGSPVTVAFSNAQDPSAPGTTIGFH